MSDLDLLNLEELRAKIDDIDSQICSIVNDRMKFVRQIGHIKENEKGSFYQPYRESRVYEKAVARRGDLPVVSIRAIFREIMSAALSIESVLKIGFLGEEGSFSWQAAQSHFGSSLYYEGKKSISDLFHTVANGALDYATVPLENNSEGTVKETFACLMDYDVQIYAEVYLKVSHSLIGQGSDSVVRRVYSHPQAIGQCRNYLNVHYPQVEIKETNSTTEAVRKVVSDAQGVAIAHYRLAEKFSLQILDHQIEDKHQNQTRFVIIGRKNKGKSSKDKTTLIFSLDNRPGELASVLSMFSQAHINIYKIDSRPAPHSDWTYHFLLDVEGYYGDSPLKPILDKLCLALPFVKICGSYEKILK